MSKYRFALRPLWIVSHVFVAVMVAGMVAAGFWQLNRLEGQRDREAAVADRAAQDPVDVAGLADPGDFDDADRLEFRPVTATGTYLADEQVLVGSPTLNGTPGSWVVTPLEFDDGTAVAVRRGWIANRGDLDAVPEQYAPPGGEVTVTGLVALSETKGAFSEQDPPTRMGRADVARLDERVDADLLPFLVGLSSQDPAVGDDDPQVVPISTKEDAPPHLSYAVQWFTFAAMTVVVYALILRKKARDLGREPTGEP